MFAFSLDKYRNRSLPFVANGNLTYNLSKFFPTKSRLFVGRSDTAYKVEGRDWAENRLWSKLLSEPILFLSTQLLGDTSYPIEHIYLKQSPGSKLITYLPLRVSLPPPSAPLRPAVPNPCASRSVLAIQSGNTTG